MARREKVTCTPESNVNPENILRVLLWKYLRLRIQGKEGSIVSCMCGTTTLKSIKMSFKYISHS